MKQFRRMAAALCAAFLLCGFVIPAYAYADGGEGADYGDPTMTDETTTPEPESTPEPEPTVEPGEGYEQEGNLVTRDLLYDKHTNKQFITIQTSGGNTFYIVIDYDKPINEEEEQYICRPPKQKNTDMNGSANTQKARNTEGKILSPSVGTAKNNLSSGTRRGQMQRIVIWNGTDMKNALTTAAMQNGDWTSSQPFMRAFSPVRWNGRESSLTAAR